MVAQIISTIFIAVLILLLSIAIMIWGWGLEPQSWGWIIGGYLGTILVIRIFFEIRED